jgi:hypothetical protein
MLQRNACAVIRPQLTARRKGSFRRRARLIPRATEKGKPRGFSDQVDMRIFIRASRANPSRPSPG